MTYLASLVPRRKNDVTSESCFSRYYLLRSVPPLPFQYCPFSAMAVRAVVSGNLRGRQSFLIWRRPVDPANRLRERQRTSTRTRCCSNFEPPIKSSPPRRYLGRYSTIVLRNLLHSFFCPHELNTFCVTTCSLLPTQLISISGLVDAIS